MYWIISIAVICLSVWACCKICQNKGISTGVGVALGILFGVIGILIACVIPGNNNNDNNNNNNFNNFNNYNL